MNNNLIFTIVFMLIICKEEKRNSINQKDWPIKSIKSKLNDSLTFGNYGDYYRLS